MKKLSCDDDGLSEAARIVIAGGLVVYPTDTVYGLGCDPLNNDAVRRLEATKGREKKPLPILVDSIERAEQLVSLGNEGRQLAKRFWPGPLTIVAKLKEFNRDLLVSHRTAKLGIRIPSDSRTLRLIEMAGGMLVGTSANKSGQRSPSSADEVLGVLGSSFDILLDGGVCQLGIESTVIDVSEDQAAVLRSGALSAKELGIPT
ncbi:MAG: L-threonylcarbamoyladenylate synthase [Nitrososphaerales archaeon]